MTSAPLTGTSAAAMRRMPSGQENATRASAAALRLPFLGPLVSAFALALTLADFAFLGLPVVACGYVRPRCLSIALAALAFLALAFATLAEEACHCMLHSPRALVHRFGDRALLPLPLPDRRPICRDAFEFVVSIRAAVQLHPFSIALPAKVKVRA